MKLNYTLTLDVYRAAQALHRRQKFTRQLAIWIWPALVILGLIGMIAFAVSRHEELFADSAAFTSGALFISLWMPIGRWYTVRKCFKQLFPPARTDPSSSLEIDAEQIVSSIPGVSEGKILWRGILQFAQDNEVTMIHTTESRFLFFPTAVLTPGQREELKQIVIRNAVKSYIC